IRKFDRELDWSERLVDQVQSTFVDGRPRYLFRPESSRIAAVPEDENSKLSDREALNITRTKFKASIRQGSPRRPLDLLLSRIVKRHILKDILALQQRKASLGRCSETQHGINELTSTITEYLTALPYFPMPPSERTRTLQSLRRRNAIIPVGHPKLIEVSAELAQHQLAQHTTAMQSRRSSGWSTLRGRTLFTVGEHFTRNVNAFLRVSALLTNGFIISVALSEGSDGGAEKPKEAFTPEAMRQYCAYRQLACTLPFLDDLMKNGSEEEIAWIGRMALTTEIIEWIDPSGLCPPLRPRVKVNRGFHHSATGPLLCPVHLD
ncbi:hypothetical protein DXG01_008562, partial [Tephrocybe rancida]